MTEVTHAIGIEIDTYEHIYKELMGSMVDDKKELLPNLPMFLTRTALAHIVFIDGIYREILEVHGSIVEFGCGYGRNLALFTELRNIYEPWNLTRRIIGIDTFTGHSGIIPELDGGYLEMGDYGLPNRYEHRLNYFLEQHKNLGVRPRAHTSKVLKRDVMEMGEVKLDGLVDMIALAYIDLNLAQPTHHVIQAILVNQMVKGGIVVFDEANCKETPGETGAIREYFKPYGGVKLIRDPYTMHRSWTIWE